MGSALAGHVAIITGASRGMGRAIALRLAAEGARLLLTGRTLEDGSHELPGGMRGTVREIEALGGSAIAMQADLSDPYLDRAAILQRAREAWDRPVDILVNNAAAPREFQHRFQDVPHASFRDTLEVNVWSAWELTQLAVPGMRELGGGWVVNVSSRSAGPIPGPPFRPSPVGSQSLYGGSKAMLDRITSGAAMDLYDDRIAVNALAPEAAIATENAVRQLELPPEICEPLETFAEATVALCSCDPARLTGRATYSLSLLVELGRPVYGLDGKDLLPGWQPDEIDRARLRPGYLDAARELERPRG